MLELNVAGLAMHAASPMAYCDHFALRNIAEDEALSAQLVAALRASGGTLAVSWLNLGEYSTVTDRTQRLEAERMLDRILPSVYLIDVDPSAVSKRELAGEQYPHADLLLAPLFVHKRELTISASGIDMWLSASGLFEPLNHPVLRGNKARLARLWLEALNQRRQDYVTKPAFHKLVSAAVRHPEQAATKTDAVARTLAATFFPDQRRVLKLNDRLPSRRRTSIVLRCCPAGWADVGRGGARAAETTRHQDRDSVLRARRRHSTFPCAHCSSPNLTSRRR